jgi:hypothetical protein
MIMTRFNTFPRRPQTRNPRPPAVPLQLEPLEARNLLSGGLTNVLVNDPTTDAIPKQDTESETAIVLGADSKVVVAYNDDGAFSYPTPFNPTVAGYSLSSDGGASFTDEGQPPDGSPYWGAFDQVLARSNKTGTIFLSDNSYDTSAVALAQRNGSGERVNVFRSADNGATFSAPLNGTPGFVAGVDVADKPWIAVDNYPGPGYGNAYLAWTDFTNNFEPTSSNNGTYFTRSTDDGLTWGPSGGVPIVNSAIDNNEVSHGAFVAVGPDHAVYVFYWGSGYQNGGETELMRKSTDYGQTFGPQVIVANLKTNGVNGDLGLTNSVNQSFRTNAFPQAAINPVTGDIYVVYDDEPKEGTKDKADIFFTMSTDSGNSWSKPLRVNDDTTTNDQWQPALAVTPDGSHVGIFWYDRRLDPANNLIDRFGTIGDVAGHTVTFGPNFRINDVSFPPALGQDTFVNSTYMGDYDMATADNSYFYTTWGDNRLPDAFFANQPDVRFAKIPVTGLECDTALLASSSLGATPAGSTGTAAVPRPNASLADFAGGNDLLLGAFVAAAADRAVPLPDQGVSVVSATRRQISPATPPAWQAGDLFLVNVDKEDPAWTFATARGPRHGAGERWEDVLGEIAASHDPLAVFPSKAK